MIEVQPDWLRNPNNKPKWDDYFMALAFVASSRSMDPHTAHGCVIVNQSNHILSVGYNSPPPGIVDSLVPLTRPEKYDYFSHAESNAIDNASCSLHEAKVYVTGYPCHTCFARMIHNKISKVIYGPVGSHCVDPKSKSIIGVMNTSYLSPDKKLIEIEQYRGNNEFINVMYDTISYANKKLGKI